MPHQRENDRNRGEERADGRKGNADLHDLVFRDQVGGQILEHMLQLARALGGVIATAGDVRDLFQRILVDAPAKSAAAKSPAAESPAAKRLAALKLAAIRKLRPAGRAEP